MVGNFIGNFRRKDTGCQAAPESVITPAHDCAPIFRAALAAEFRRSAQEISDAAQNRWEEVHIAMGIAEYESGADRSVSDVVRRADKTMYANKRARKTAAG